MRKVLSVKPLSVFPAKQGSSPFPAGLVIAGSASNSGKTILTVGLARALCRRNLKVGVAKCGPDYIDPRFLTRAAKSSALNLDPWAMTSDRILALAGRAAANCDVLLVEGVMGLYDGAKGGKGSTDQLASTLGLPIVLAIPSEGTAQSVAAVASGFATHSRSPGVSGVIATRTASDRHESLICEGFQQFSVPLLGCLRRNPHLSLKSRHLGLIQADEVTSLETVIEQAADAIDGAIDLDQLIELLKPVRQPTPEMQNREALAPLGQRIAIADDLAFAFSYPHLLSDWRENGAELSFFSPLSDEPPPTTCDAVYLPGGYPELYADKLSQNQNFIRGLKLAAETGSLIYGECGGYMVLGEALIDQEGVPHPMSGLLPVTTSFENRKLHLGYRTLKANRGRPWCEVLTAHEFHYASLISEDYTKADPLFSAWNGGGDAIGDMGLRRGNVMGSFAHVIDSA